jgi:hypothetical protein
MVESFFHIPQKVTDKLEQTAKDSFKLVSALQPEQSTNQESAGDFVCEICLNIVELEMVECSTCKKLSCKKCTAGWRNRHANCPSCRAGFAPTQPSRIVVNALKNMEFKCKSCPKVFKYSDFKSHQIKCKRNTAFACSLCGESGMAFEEMQTHWLH